LLDNPFKYFNAKKLTEGSDTYVSDEDKLENRTNNRSPYNDQDLTNLKLDGLSGAGQMLHA
jgi:hypothetical protein